MLGDNRQPFLILVFLQLVLTVVTWLKYRLLIICLMWIEPLVFIMSQNEPMDFIIFYTEPRDFIMFDNVRWNVVVPAYHILFLILAIFSLVPFLSIKPTLSSAIPLLQLLLFDSFIQDLEQHLAVVYNQTDSEVIGSLLSISFHGLGNKEKTYSV